MTILTQRPTCITPPPPIGEERLVHHRLLEPGAALRAFTSGATR